VRQFIRQQSGERLAYVSFVGGDFHDVVRGIAEELCPSSRNKWCPLNLTFQYFNESLSFINMHSAELSS
jgi:hypothetical protein